MMSVSTHTFKVDRWNLHVMYGGCLYQHHSRAIGWQSLVAAFAQRREPGLPSLLAGLHKLATRTCVAGKIYFTYLSPLGKKPRKQYHRWFYNRGLKLCYRCSFRGEWERTCVVKPSDEGWRNDDSITQQQLWAAVRCEVPIVDLVV